MVSKRSAWSVTGELLAACRNGDSGAFEEVVRGTYRQVYTQALRIVGDRQEAEDVAQEAYLRVFRGLAGFRGDAQFETWLYRIVANAALTHLRRRRRFGELMADPGDEELEPADAGGAPETVADRDALAGAMASLSPALRAVVVLKDVYGLSCQEIGDQLGVSEGAVKVRLHRARRRLKELLFPPQGVPDEV
jgi:RNA polymerase sigma-70 factor (ECF subfamily)